MKIVFLIEELGGGGKERRLVELMKGLSKDSNYEIHLVLTKSTNRYAEVNKLPIKIHQINPVSNIKLFKKYHQLLKNIKPDVVHTWSFKTSFYAALLKPRIGYKLFSGFVTNTFGQSLLHEIICSMLIYKASDLVLSNSNLGLEAYKVNKNKGYVIYNGFDSNRLTNKSDSKTLLQSIGVDAPLTVIMVANVTSKKDYKTFIKVAHEVIEKYDHINFVSVGSINPEYEELVKPYIDNKHDKIKFIGFHNNPVQLIQESDIGILCSEREGISNSILEYMAAGLPVITTDKKGASKELISDGINGFICEKSEATQKLLYLIKDPALREKIGMANFEKIKKEFSIERMVTEHKNIYAQQHFK